ncbi:competence protein CoiA family protein [Kitasatospora kifunensis]|uniref:Competence protein CoiA n=1 Tax=Kitasatospora kifunensis TaxID=58351 RepID=A0A7W7W0F6_KITKI|nr:competence protein CoiA family protein [Kitasatospora kifunensis]MBB4929113.1 competence protein CoiA [Kitasatospora kifunensis]
MQFTAVHGEWGRVDVTLPDLGVGRSWEAIHRVRGIELTCPECGGQVFARVSQLGNRHIYHRVKPPSCSLANESLEHHLLKLELVTLARAVGFRAELEVGDPAGLWRADVMVFDQDGGWLMALEVQLSPITVEDIKHRTSRYARDGVRVCWFGLQPRPWAGSVPTLLVDLPESRDAAWKVTAGLARFDWNPRRRNGPALWEPVDTTLADAVAWVLRGQIVLHRATRHSKRVNGLMDGEWAEGWTGSGNHSWQAWWTAPAYTALAHQHVQHVEEEERREREAAERRAERERLEAIRRAEQERERAKKQAAKDQAYRAFWARTGMNRAYWRVFADVLTGYTGKELVFGVPDPAYGDGRPAFRCTAAGRPDWTEPVAVACPDPGKLRAWAEELPILVYSDQYLDVLASRAWAPMTVFVVDIVYRRVTEEQLTPG